jgi:hypothetical protein
MPAYTSVVAKLAGLFKHLEETTRFLSNDSSYPNTGRIYAICEILLEDLNNYCEAMIPIDESNTLNIKLFPAYPTPPPLSPHNVPLATVKLSALTDNNWDLTMLRILPFIDGVNSIRGIARLADADYKLVRKAVAHLVYYGCVTLLDIFNFAASYATSSEIASLVADTDMQEEGRRYSITADTTNHHNDRLSHLKAQIDGTRLVELYCSLKQGQSIKNWCMEHSDIVGVLDVRRFITFGVIKGFLYRVHKYALLVPPSSNLRTGNVGNFGLMSPKVAQHGLELTRMLDGNHCFDEICTDLMISERELIRTLKSMGDVQIIQR